jgi:hypothetical protein
MEIITNINQYALIDNESNLITNNLPDSINVGILKVYYHTYEIHGRVFWNLVIRNWDTWATLFISSTGTKDCGHLTIEEFITEYFNECSSKGDIIKVLISLNRNRMKLNDLQKIAKLIIKYLI